MRNLYLAMVAGLMALPTSYVFADDSAGSNSEFIHQTEAGKFELTPGLVYGNVSASSKNGGPSVAAVTTPFSVEGEYGVNSMFSVGLTLSYASTSNKINNCPACTNTSTTSKGLSNPDINIVGRYPLGSGTLRFGGDLELTMTDATTDSSGNSNADSGGMTLTPFVGYEMPMGPGLLGVKVAYDLYKGDRKSDVTATDGSGTVTNETISGGNSQTYSVFYEAKVAPTFTLGAALLYTSDPGTVTKTSSASASGNDNTSSIGIQPYLTAQVADNVAILGTLIYDTITVPSSASTGNETVYGVGVGARIAF